MLIRLTMFGKIILGILALLAIAAVCAVVLAAFLWAMGYNPNEEDADDL